MNLLKFRQGAVVKAEIIEVEAKETAAEPEPKCEEEIKEAQSKPK